MQAHEIIRQTRLSLELTQSAAAARCCVSFSAYEKWERGAKIMPPVLVGLLVMLGADAPAALKAARSLLPR